MWRLVNGFGKSRIQAVAIVPVDPLSGVRCDFPGMRYVQRLVKQRVLVSFRQACTQQEAGTQPF